jgi:hypothetical protein
MPFPVDCTTSHTGHLLSASDIAFDWDTNCFMNATSRVWRSKVGDHTASWAGMSATMRELDLDRGLYRFTHLATMPKVVFPFDISPAAQPDFTVEMLFFQTTALTSVTGFRALFTTEAPGNTVPTARGRGGLIGDQTGAGVALAPWCTTSNTTGRLPMSTGIANK